MFSVVLLFNAVTITATATSTATATAQTDSRFDSGRLDLVAQTTFVGSDPTTIDLRVTAPDEATIRVQIYSALTNREDIRASYQNTSGQPFSDFTCDANQPQKESPCRLNYSNAILTIEIPDHEIGEILRVRQGALPVVITLNDGNGETIDSVTTHLLVLDERDLDQRELEGQRPAVLHIAFISSLSEPLAVQPDQTINLDTDSLLAKARRIASYRQAPITVAVQPETLQALATTSSEQLNELAELLTGRPVLQAPWVELDEEAWRLSGDTDLIARQYKHGARVIAETLGHAPAKIAKLAATATPQTLALLRSHGIEAVVVEPDQIIGDASGVTGTTDAAGRATPVITIDTTLRQALSHNDPQLAGQRALTELAIEAANATTDTTILIDLDDIEGSALNVVLEGINERNDLQTSSLTRALQVPVAHDTNGRPIQARLRAVSAPDLSQRSADIAVTRGIVNAYASMVAPATAPVTALETLLRAAASASLNDQQSASYTQTVLNNIVSGTANIRVAPTNRITLTDRQGEILVTVHNGQPLPINVDLLFSAEKLRFEDSQRLARTLVPGDNHIPVQVETLASGDARITVAITSPGGQLEITEGTIDIRSTAISGLGLIISTIALVVLGGWWLRTIRRVRRNRLAATVKATTETQATTQTQATQAEPTQPELAHSEPAQPATTNKQTTHNQEEP